MFSSGTMQAMFDLPPELIARLAQLPTASTSLLVGFSGGMDSTVLLHALAQLPGVRQRGLRAIHVNHGLHANSGVWAQHCRDVASALQIPLQIVGVDVPGDIGSGPEAAARDARMRAFTDALGTGEVLVLAHHGDDQAETTLLKLLRGAGPEGLGGMRDLRLFEQGWLWRPLLRLPRSTIAAYAQAHDLKWIDDPSNSDTRLRRNFLRHEILPHLAQCWPQAQTAIAHSATWARAASDYIETQAQQAWAQLQNDDPATLDWQAWLQLDDALRDPVLRLWLRALDLDAPAHFHVIELERQLRHADPDRSPCVSWDNTQVRRYRRKLHAMRVLTAMPHNWESVWDGSALALPDDGTLLMQSTTSNAAATFAPALHVRYRRGGERFQFAANTYHRQLRGVLQDAGVPPWLRERIPLIFAQDELIAIGDCLINDRARVLCEACAGRIVWNKDSTQI